MQRLPFCLAYPIYFHGGRNAARQDMGCLAAFLRAFA